MSVYSVMECIAATTTSAPCSRAFSACATACATSWAAVSSPTRGSAPSRRRSIRHGVSWGFSLRLLVPVTIAIRPVGVSTIMGCPASCSFA